MDRARRAQRHLQRRARLIETLYVFWSDILRSKTGVAKKELPGAQAATSELASRLDTAEILRRLRRIEELRDHLGRNIQEALALETAFLRILAL
jgi:DNA polymerase III gamma/tau subunit